MASYKTRLKRLVGLLTPRTLNWFGVSAWVLVLDQVSKLMAHAWLDVLPTPVIPFVSLTLACNTGAAFSILEGHSGLLATIGIVLAGVFVYLIIRLPKERVLEGTAFSFILAGAIGNVIDRLTRGCVLDFIHVHHGEWHFPIFNLADSAITVGAALWILSLIRSETTSLSVKDQQSES